jgi:hypothetical protein
MSRLLTAYDRHRWKTTVLTIAQYVGHVVHSTAIYKWCNKQIITWLIDNPDLTPLAATSSFNPCPMHECGSPISIPLGSNNNIHLLITYYAYMVSNHPTCSCNHQTNHGHVGRIKSGVKQRLGYEATSGYPLPCRTSRLRWDPRLTLSGNS